MKTSLSMKIILANAAAIFAVSILMISLLGVCFPDHIDSSPMFTEHGLTFSIIFQYYLFSIISSFIISYVISEDHLVHYSYLQRIAFVVLTIFFVAIVFIFIFEWMPIDDVQAWVSFIFMYLFSFISCFVVFYLLFRNEEKKYMVLLDEYRERKKEL